MQWRLRKPKQSQAPNSRSLHLCFGFLRRQEDEVKDRESTVLRREIEVDEKERNVERTTASLVRKRRELKILEKSIKRREEALREKMI